MNDTLKTELKNYFKVIKERKELIEKEIEKLDFDKNDFTDKIEKKLAKSVIEILRAKNFHFFDGANGDRINIHRGGLLRIKPYPEGARLETRSYKHKSWYELDFLNDYGEKISNILPNGFEEAIEEIIDMTKSIDKVNTNFEKSMGAIIPISYIGDNKLETVKITNIVLTDYFDIRINNDDYFSDTEQAYYNDEIYDIMKTLVKERTTKLQRKHEILTAKCNEILDFIDNKLSTILVKTRLTEMM